MCHHIVMTICIVVLVGLHVSKNKDKNSTYYVLKVIIQYAHISLNNTILLFSLLYFEF